MRLAYNMTLPAVHLLALLTLLAMGFARMMAWLCWFWVNDLIYLLTAAAFLSGHWLLLKWGQKKQLTLADGVVTAMATADYILYSLQLALTVAWLVWDAALPLLVKDKSASIYVPLALLPVAAVDICAMVLRQKFTQQLRPKK